MRNEPITIYGDGEQTRSFQYIDDLVEGMIRLMDEGWGSADFLDDNAPDAVGGLRDYVDPAILKRGRPAFVALGDNKLRVELLQKLAAAGYSTPVFISDAASVSPSAVLEPGCIILPQALRLSIPGWSNEFSILLKDSALCFVLGTPEIMARTHFVASRTYEHLPLYITAGLLYFGITLVGVHILRVLERKVHIPGYAVSGSM